MCKNATSQVVNLLAAVKPTLDALLKITGVPTATIANVDAAYAAAETALATWQPGDTSATVDQSLNALLSVVESLNAVIPPEATALLAIAISGIEAVIGIVGANNETAPEAQAKLADDAIAKVQANVPEFKMGFFDKAKAELGDTRVAAGKYKSEWNKAVAKADPKYAALRVA
jgi:hypothetical protein